MMAAIRFLPAGGCRTVPAPTTGRDSFIDLPGLFPPALLNDPAWRRALNEEVAALRARLF